MGKSSINGPIYTMAMLNNQRVISINLAILRCPPCLDHRPSYFQVRHRTLRTLRTLRTPTPDDPFDVRVFIVPPSKKRTKLGVG